MERSGRLFSDYTYGQETSSTITRYHGGASDHKEELYDGLDVLEVSERKHIPSVEINHIGVSNKNLGTSHFSLGGGLSAQVVQHVTSEETEEILPANTVVALKMYMPHATGRSSTTSGARSSVYRTIMREIKAFSSFSRRGPLNVAQLRFVAWHKDQPFPMLAMELGNYGTLDHIICSHGSDSLLSLSQKQHITLDIALGLRDVHVAGFVHGDLKPENIIVVSHSNPRREIVAKLLDFGGSSQSLNFGGSPKPLDKLEDSGPLHFSPLWCAPEVASPSRPSDLEQIDWRKCDVYSYGLIVASIWGRETSGKLSGAEGRDTHLQSSVMSEFLDTAKISVRDTDALAQLREMQLRDWRDSNSLTSVLRTQLLTKVMPYAFDTPHLAGVILSALHANPSHRPTAGELVPMLEPFFKRLQRNIPL
ncbi:Leucine-rich repeat serine/threonine-protein kinase 2 [Colletotrichum chlorophyti]|uniref:Leucine-rich repeat serine/threonine-protein kinase 2 n=1 Tax=Colletotrichum chlorophyti TaxID=708187 RepID=A0A1Q8S227_9PEZI|nr:Leucine-rich repeat serine/threonine-protein kinase 2 [Colletotrichum chlorophyti]